MTVSFICVPFSRVKQKEWGTWKVIPLRTCLKEVFFFPQRGIKSRMFFSFFFLVILHHCAPPSSLKTMHILPGESSNITTLLHRYSSLGSFTFSHPFSLSSPFLFSALPPPRLLVCFPVRRPSFHVLPTPCALRSSLPPSLVLYLATFTSAARRALLPSFAPISLTFHLHMRVLILKSWPTTDIQY